MFCRSALHQHSSILLSGNHHSSNLGSITRLRIHSPQCYVHEVQEFVNTLAMRQKTLAAATHISTSVSDAWVMGRPGTSRLALLQLLQLLLTGLGALDQALNSSETLSVEEAALLAVAHAWECAVLQQGQMVGKHLSARSSICCACQVEE